MATELQFYLNISREEVLRYYQGSARFVRVTATTGQKIQFPAEHLRAFIGANGIEGKFSIQFDENHKLVGLKKV